MWFSSLRRASMAAVLALFAHEGRATPDGA